MPMMTLRYFLELFIQLTTQLILENMASMQDIAQKKSATILLPDPVQLALPDRQAGRSAQAQSA